MVLAEIEMVDKEVKTIVKEEIINLQLSREEAQLLSNLLGGTSRIDEKDTLYHMYNALYNIGICSQSIYHVDVKPTRKYNV